MKICQINCIYGFGSTGKITRDIHHSLLSRGIGSIVIVPEKNVLTHEDGCFTIATRWQSLLSALFRRSTGFQYDGAIIQTSRLLSILKKEKPDIVHLQCINGNNINVFWLLKYLAKHRIKTLMTLHAEFPYTGGCGHAYDCMKWLSGCGSCPRRKEATQSFVFDFTARTWRKWKDSYSCMSSECFMYIAVSPWLLERAMRSPLLDRFKGAVVLNGVDTSVFHYHAHTSTVWRERYGIDADDRILVFVTDSFYPKRMDLKGGRFIVELANYFIRKKRTIIVAANRGDNSGCPKNLIYIGSAKSQEELASLYSAADLSLVVSRRETFSMPVAESLCCGTPVVGFKAGGPESIALPDYSHFVNYGDMECLVSEIDSFLKMIPNKQSISSKACQIYSKELMLEGYVSKYQEMM